MVFWSSTALSLLFLSFAFGLFLFLALRSQKKLSKELRPGFEHSNVELSIRGIPSKVHYRWVHEGDRDRPVILLIHGLGANLTVWRHLIPLLKDKYRVLALDLPGFGLSPDLEHRYGAELDLLNELIVDLIHHLKIQGPVHVVGNSMGALIALGLMESNPRLFTKSVLINPALAPGLAWLPVHQMQWLALPVSKFVKKDLIRILYNRTISNPKNLEPEVLEFTSNNFVGNPNGLKSFARYVGLIKRQSLKKFEPSHSLFIFSEGDRVVTKRHRKTIQALYPQAKVLTHPTGGHQLQEDEPQWLSEQISHFFNSHKA